MISPRHAALLLAASLSASTAFAQAPATTGTDAPTPVPVGQSTLAPTPTPAHPAAPVYVTPQVELVGSNVPQYMLRGTIHAPDLPPRGFTVQYFFLANLQDDRPLINAAFATTINQEFNNINILAPLATPPGYFEPPGVGHNIVVDSTGAAKAPDLTPISPRGVAGITRVMGWIVRILAGDQVIYTVGSEERFSTLAREYPDYFNKIFALYAAAAQSPDAGAGFYSHPPQRLLPNYSGTSSTRPVFVTYPTALPQSNSMLLASGPTITGNMSHAASPDNPIAVVSGKIHFFTPPTGPYKIVCSFMTYQAHDKTFYVGNEMEKEASGADVTFEFTARVLSSRPDGRLSGNDLYSDWYIRVISDGKLIGAQASRASAPEYFKKNPQALENEYIQSVRAKNAADKAARAQ